MCGIAGLVTQRAPGSSRGIAGAMAACLEHRGPDAAGDWSDASGVVAFGFRRLAVLDLSDAGNQPMTSPDGRFAIMLNGEIWTVLMFQAWLAESGGMYRTSGT